MDKLLRYFDRYRIKCAKLVCPMLPRMQELFQVVDPVEVIIHNADAEVVNIPWKEAKRLAGSLLFRDGTAYSEKDRALFIPQLRYLSLRPSAFL